MRWLALCCALAACGRERHAGDAPPGDVTVDDAPPDGVPPDAVPPDGVPDAPPPVNRAFVTSGTFTGNLGGLVGADAKCAMAATSAGLTGTFIALLSTSTVDARDRLGVSRGWVRVDGAPIADGSGIFFAGLQFNPLDLDETGIRIGSTGDTWTGSLQNGVVDSGLTCTDWTVTTGAGRTGYAHYGSPQWNAFSTAGCANLYHLYCFEIGHTTPVAPSPSTGRYAFLSGSRTGQGLAALDAQCQQEATAHALPGTYLAAVATTTTTIASRFTGTDWRRPDGTPVGTAGHSLFSSDPRSFVHQFADGAYLVDPTVFTGASSATAVGTDAQTCNNWNDLTTGALTGGGGKPTLLENGYFWNQVIACSQFAGVICLQQ